MSSLTSPRPKRNCKSRSALELLSGADLPELDAVPRRSGGAAAAAAAASGGGSPDKEASAHTKSAKSKANAVPHAKGRGDGEGGSGRGGAAAATSSRSPAKPARPGARAVVAGGAAAAASAGAATAAAASPAAAPLTLEDDGDVADAAYILEHFLDPTMLVILNNIAASDSLERHAAVAGRRGAKHGLKCKYCGLLYQTKFDFVTHLQSHTAAHYKPWRCSLCSFTVAFRSSLIVHLNIHAERKSVTCELCGRGFDTKQKLKQHSTRHGGSKTEICTYCGQIFDDQSMLRYHLSTDHGDLTPEMVAGSWLDRQKMEIVEMIVEPVPLDEATEQSAPETTVVSYGTMAASNEAAPNSQSDDISSSVEYLPMSVVAAKDDSLAEDDREATPFVNDTIHTTGKGMGTAAATAADVHDNARPSYHVVSSGGVSNAAEGSEDIVVVDPHACYEPETVCDVPASSEEAAAPETEDERIAVMALEALEAEGASGPVDDTAADGTVSRLFTVDANGAAVAVCEGAGSSAVTSVAAAPAVGFVGHNKELLAEHEIVLQITRVDHGVKDFLGSGLVQKSNTVLISLPVDATGGKSLMAGSKRPKAPVIIGSPKTIKRNSDGISLLATTSPGTASSAVVIDDGSTSGIAVDIADTSAADDGGNGSSSDGGGKSGSGGKMEIDDVLLEYCSFDEDKPGKKPTINCKFCEYPFRSQTSFTNHLRKVHSDMNIKPYKCHLCQYRAALKGNLEQHIKFHAQERPFTCPVCSKGFIQKYKLDLHLKFHENRREYKCDQCGSAFNDKQDLSRHNKNVHFPMATAVMCDTCNKPFKNKRNLEMHLHVHTGAKEFSCDVCGKQYSTRESLRSHMKGHQYQFGCEICAKPLGSYSAFIAHKRLHDPNQKGYECDVCGKVLLFRATLEAHKLNVHSTERPFKCDQCPKAFKTKGQLTNHVISHRKDKPYTCEVCGYSVKRRDSLRLHMYRHASVKPYRCGRCNKEYTQKQALEIHLKAKHAGITTFNCPNCEKGFNTNYLLKKHMQKAHNLDVTAMAQPGAPSSEQVIIAEESVEEVEAAAAVKKQTVLINAHICEHCTEVFASQHALALHILTDHMNQQKWLSSEAGIHPVAAAASSSAPVPTSVPGEDGQVVSIAETIEIPIGEEMLIVQAVQAADSMPSDGTQHELMHKAGEAAIMVDPSMQPGDKHLTT